MEELIHRLLNGSPLSESESRNLLDWLRASETHRRTFTRIYREWGNSHTNSSHYNAEQAYHTFKARITPSVAKPTARNNLRTIGIRIAAAAMICIMIYSIRLWNYDSSEIDIKTFTELTTSPDFTRENVELLLPEGKNILFSETNPTIIYDGNCIKINGREEAISAAKGDTPFNQLLIPFGRQSHLTLSDGTRIWINAGSKLVYPTTFNGDTREIHIEGEVYMEVAHDPSHPFIVHSGDMNVRVLGTKFYLSSYGPENTHEVVLLSGAVSVTSTLMPEHEIQIAPDQQAILDKDGEIGIHKVSALNFISWIDGYINCDNEPLNSILERIARRYNCHIDHTDAVADLPISGKLELQPDVNDVLRILSLTAPIRIHQSGNGQYMISLIE